MEFLRFEHAEVSPEKLDAVLAVREAHSPGWGAGGSYMTIRLPDDDFHYYNFTKPKVLRAIKRFLVTNEVPFEVVFERELPEHIQEFVRIYSDTMRKHGRDRD